jgi:hypothetical protein
LCAARRALGGLAAAHRHINHTNNRWLAGCTLYTCRARENKQCAECIMCICRESVASSTQIHCSPHQNTARLSLANHSHPSRSTHPAPAPTHPHSASNEWQAHHSRPRVFFIYTYSLVRARRTFISANGLCKYLESFICKLVSPIYFFIVPVSLSLYFERMVNVAQVEIK